MGSSFAEQRKVTVPEGADEAVALSFSSIQDIPKELSVYVSADQWSSFSAVRKSSFKMIFDNPNAFFYRNRPPGENRRFGAFSKDEEAQFFERLHRFRDILGVHDRLWGLFAVPFVGRVGYQCSNFYRQLLREGRLTDESYEVNGQGKLHFLAGRRRCTPRDSQKELEDEAFKFVRDCLNKTDPDEWRAKAVKEIHVRSAKPKSRPKIVEPVFKQEDSDSEDDEMSALQYARDSVTGKPMVCPCLDATTGVVLDLSTWRLVLRGGYNDVNVNTKAASVADLVKMTKRNFERYKMDIVNVAF